jgi:predicted DCC family thiol-disulfide oxidoreductase YuxK
MTTSTETRRAASGAATHPLLFDEECGFCRWSRDKVVAWDRRGLLRPVAIQSDEGQALLAAIPEDERLDSWHLVLPSGEVLSAGEAAEPLTRLLPGGRPLAWLFRTFPRFTERTYRFVDRNRSVFSRLLRIDRDEPHPGA